MNSRGAGGTALGAAVFLARKDVVEFLLSKGADVELPSLQSDVPKGSDDPMPKWLSRAPLHLAAYQGYVEITKILLAAKANPSATSEDGTTVLHMAATYDRPEVVELLLNAKADPNARDKDGATPLHYNAARAKATSAALIAAGGDIHAKAEKGPYAGKTPLEINPRLELFASLAPNWGKSDINIPENLAKEVRMLKYMTYALRSFSEKHCSYPSDQTAATLEKSFKDTVLLKGNTANDFFRQLLFTTDFPESVGASVTGSGVSGKTDWTYSYVPGGAFHDNPDRPVVLVPLLDGERRFDTNAQGGNAVILFADFSVRHFPIEPDGRVLINDLDIFDPKQPFWANSKPDIKWPRPTRR